MLKNGVLTIWFSSLVLLQHASAADVSYPVYVRDHDQRIVLENHDLEDLKSESALDGVNFRVVNGKDEVPIALDQSEFSVRAASVYHNLNVARKFWVQRLKEDGLKHVGVVTVRMDITNEFTELAHYANDKFKAEINDIESIPKSDQERMSKYAPWNYEIWVRPVKKVKVKTDLAAFDDASRNSQMKQQLALGFLANSLSQYASTSMAYHTLLNPQYHLEKLLIDFGIVELVPEALGLLGRLVKQTYYLDTATIPEVIYHEYTHIALSQFLPIGDSTPLLEGMANYFAIQILGSPEILNKLGSHGKTDHTMSGLGWTRYSEAYETHAYSWENFTIQVLYHLGEEFGQDKIQEALLIALERLATVKSGDFSKANIRNDLIDSLYGALLVLYPPSEKYNIAFKMNHVLDRLGL